MKVIEFLRRISTSTTPIFLLQSYSQLGSELGALLGVLGHDLKIEVLLAFLEFNHGFTAQSLGGCARVFILCFYSPAHGKGRIVVGDGKHILDLNQFPIRLMRNSSH